MAVFLLPGLSANAAITPGTAGAWTSSDGVRSFLQGLSDGLAVAPTKNQTESIDSIPDVWARPMFFRMALYSNNANNNFDATLHEKARGEWRALLAMLALQGMRNLNITVEAVHLTNAADDPLARMLFSLAPNDSVVGNGQADWGDIYIISFNGSLLAVTSPATLVVPVADYAAGTFTEPWSDDGHHLTDPIRHLAPNELSGLHSWLVELEHNLSNDIPLGVQQNNQTCRQLFDALNQYKNDVKNAAGGTFVHTDGIIGANLNMHIGIFARLNRKVRPPIVTPDSSAVRIRTSKAREKSKPMLLVSPTMLDKLSTSWGIPKSQLVIWGGITAVNINEQSLGGGNSMIDGVSLGNAQWRRPEDFFTNHLVVCGGDVWLSTRKARGSDVMSEAGMSPFLPLRQEILDYFTPAEIANNLVINDAGAAIDVQFTFPLSGMNGRQLEYTMKKSYPKNGGVIFIDTTVPVVEIWPDFKRAGWDKYYLYYENPDAQNDRHGTSIGFFYVYPWAYGQNIAGNDTPSRGLRNLYTARLSGFPEALICTVNVANDDGVYARTVDAGLVLLSEPKSVPIQTGKRWQFGIDFGTSGTMLYYREGNNDPNPLPLKPHLFQVTKSADDLRNRTYRNFIPSSTTDQQAGSFLSIFQQLNNIQMGARIRPLQDGNVFWLLSAEGDNANDFRGNSGRIDANLKWKNDTVGRQKVEAYIKQICMQSLAEAAQNEVDEVSWNFSYPTAFSVNQRMTFNQTCEAAADDAVQDSGFALGDVDDWAESKAIAYCFRRAGGHNLAGGALCLDIGAGTTDISVVSGTPAKIVYHTSLQFAGRYLFRSIYKNHALFADKTLTLDNMDNEKKNALIDADMRKYNDDYLGNLRYKAGNDNVEKALQIAQFAAAGIFYYLGELIGFLHSKGIYQEANVPEIYIGGNGSRIFSWICGGRFSNRNPYMRVFRDLFVAESGLPGGVGFRIVLSTTPKVEVSCGMVEDTPPNDEDFFDPITIANALFGDDGADPLIASSLFAGDAFISEDTEHKKTDFISAYDINKGVKLERVDELNEFLTKFNDRHHQIRADGNRISIDDDQQANVSRAVSGVYANQIGLPEQDIFVEPVFILELKKFVEMLC